MKILLKNGLVYDGTTSKPQILDVYIEDGIINKIGIDLNFDSDRIIDCTGLIVAPGFIDAHSHNDFFVVEDQSSAIVPFLKQGITTQVIGNCGFSSYGVGDSQYKDLVGSGLFKTKECSSLKEYKEMVKGELIVNQVSLVGHGTTRISVNGNKATKLTEEQKESMLHLTEEAMKDGAFGGSLGLMYEPGMYAPKEELIDFAKVIAKHNGILTVHPRANSKVAMGYPLIGKPHIEQALDEMIEIARASKVKLENSHLIFVGKSSWKCVDPMLKSFYKAREEGIDIAYDIYPFTYGASVITVILPSWYMKLSSKERNKPFNKFKLHLIINITKKLLGIDFSDLKISYISDEHKEFEGKTVAYIAKENNVKPIDMYLKLVDLSNGKGRIMLDKYYNEEIIEKLMKDELSIFMTDAWYEKSGTQNGGTFQAFPYFIEKSIKFDIPLEDTISKMTGKTANRFNIKDRGYIKEGLAADVCVFNKDDIKVNIDIPDETPDGIKYVLINGEIALENNVYQNTKNGIVLSKI